MNDYDYIVVGAGPAGVQMGYFLEKAKRKYVVLEKNEKAGKFFERHPRNRTLISINKRFNFFEELEFNMRHDWNSLLSDDPTMRFVNYSKELYPNAGDLVRYVNDFVEHFKLNIRYNSNAVKISKPNGRFSITLEDGQVLTSTCLLMATGAMYENLPSTIEGIEMADTYSLFDDKDTKKYENKIVLIIGGGNSAFETANLLAGTSAAIHVYTRKAMKFAWNTHYVGDLRAVNNNIIDMYHLKSLHATIGSDARKIEKTPEGKYAVTYRDLNTHWDTPGWLYYTVEYDHIISCCGWKYVRPEMFDETIKIDTVKNGKYAGISKTWETATENMFYIGTAMAAIDRQAASGFIHGFRYNIRTLFNLLEERFFHVPLPRVEIPMTLDDVSNKIIERASLAASLYQMNGFLCDVMVMNSDKVLYYNDIPRKYVMDRPEFKSAQHLFILHLSYGFDKFPETALPVDYVHAPDFTTNRCATFLHPFLEYHTMGKYVDQTELQGSLLVRFDAWASAKFPQWKEKTNYNYVKYFVNEKMKWSDEVFDIIPFPPDIAKKLFIPLTEDEASRIPTEIESAECKPARELLSMAPKKSNRVLKPTPEDLMKNLNDLHVR